MVKITDYISKTLVKKYRGVVASREFRLNEVAPPQIPKNDLKFNLSKEILNGIKDIYKLKFPSIFDKL